MGAVRPSVVRGVTSDDGGANFGQQPRQRKKLIEFASRIMECSDLVGVVRALLRSSLSDADAPVVAVVIGGMAKQCASVVDCIIYAGCIGIRRFGNGGGSGGR